MKNLTKCPAGHFYPTRFDKCPQCHPDAVAAPAARLHPAEMIARLSDREVEHIWTSFHWNAGTAEVRALCLAEYDRRVGLANWPAHISK